MMIYIYLWLVQYCVIYKKNLKLLSILVLVCLVGFEKLESVECLLD